MADFEMMTLVAVILTGGGGVMNLNCKQRLTRVRNVVVLLFSQFLLIGKQHSALIVLHGTTH